MEDEDTEVVDAGEIVERRNGSRGGMFVRIPLLGESEISRRGLRPEVRLEWQRTCKAGDGESRGWEKFQKSSCSNAKHFRCFPFGNKLMPP